MSIKGNAGSFHEIKGSVFLPDLIRGKSAYEIAVAHGFEGTEEEWLASLRNGLSEAEVIEIIKRFMGGAVTAGTSARIVDITILAGNWVGSESPYSQVVAVEGATAYSQVDLTPSVEQLAIFYEKDIAFVTENNGGIVTVYAIGQKPTNDYTIQSTITEVGGEQDTGAAVRIGTVSLVASNWVGSESPYSQVVSIAGVTENSQVDLTPNVEQLATFHEKDIAFVTENDGGTVTVYVIGQKPTNDYTIQATITEVGGEQDTNAAIRIGAVNLVASNWSGSESLYSQVVEIAGVTENSQVDLTPSVEQLAIFHNKDLAFVTENEGGIVTVYAIGQKPENDYTIQVTITEVEE